MKNTKAFYRNLEGTNYEIGVQLGKWIQERPETLERMLLPANVFPDDKLLKAQKLLDEYCPGINDEIKGFADCLGVLPGQVMHYAMSYLERGCSLMALLPQKNEEGHTVLACTYDFNDELDDICLTKTKAEGKYAHTSTLGNTFGRINGMNEHGFAVCMSSNGVPVGDFEGGAKAEVTGLTFWSIVRSLLENCKSIEEAVRMLDKMPIGFNLNLLLADAGEKITLFQCLKGNKAYHGFTDGMDKGHLQVTNHSILSEITALETTQIKNSVQRLNSIQKVFDKKPKISKDNIRELISENYPEGLCCHYYEDFFGLLHSVVYDIDEQSIEIVFGSPQNNPWRKFSNKTFSENREFEVILPYSQAPLDFYELIEK